MRGSFGDGEERCLEGWTEGNKIAEDLVLLVDLRDEGEHLLWKDSKDMTGGHDRNMSQLMVRWIFNMDLRFSFFKQLHSRNII